MKSRVGTIVGWICAVLVSAFTLMSAVMGVLLSGDPAAIEMGERLGITGMEYQLGLVKLVIILLFLFPRTSTVGFVLMIGYYGGVLATNITHGFTFAEMAPIYVVFLLLMISAYVRNPELLARIRGKSIPA
jgi:hypothetical protein